MPDIALFKIGPLRQYELTNAACQMSSMSLGSRPITNGFRYSSTAVTTASGRWVNVAHPRPYRPGSLVSTLTMTRRIPSGAVQIVLTLVILSAGMPPDGSQAGGRIGCTSSDIESVLPVVGCVACVWARAWTKSAARRYLAGPHRASGVHQHMLPLS